jgi:hypothetical protein
VCVEAVPNTGGIDLAKAATPRKWTATDLFKLKGLAKKKVRVEKIAKTLNRTVAATKVKASLLGVSLDTGA